MEQNFHPDLLDQPEPLNRAFVAAVTLHVTLIAGMGIYSWVNSQHESFGAQNAGGGAIGIEAVKSIPLLHTGEQNPLANSLPEVVGTRCLANIQPR